MKKFLSLILLFLVLVGCGNQQQSPPARISVSSDGSYVLSTHFGRYLILWDIEHQTKTILNKKANIHSAYFIPDSHNFLWQNAKTKEVYVQSIKGDILKTLNPDFFVYGHVMTSNMDYYIAATDGWSLREFHNRKWKEIKKSFRYYSGTPILLQLSLAKNYFLTSANGQFDNDEYPLNTGHTFRDLNPDIPERSNHTLLNGVVLWTTDGKPIKKFPGNVNKTKAALSPDEKYIVAGDENGFLFRWDTKFGRRSQMDRTTSKNFPCESKKCKAYLLEEAKKNAIAPDNFNSHGHIAAVKFITEKGDFISFCMESRYGVLYHVDSPRIQAFLDLGINPHPHTFSVFDSVNVIDTAPKPGILVMGQTRVGKPDGNGTGIIVYQFDKKKKALKRIWAPDGPGKHRQIKNPENEWEY